MTTFAKPVDKHVKQKKTQNAQYNKSTLKINMKIGCLGAGYVGGPTMAVFAAQCPDVEVIVADISKERIDQWNSDSLPIFEPQLLDLVLKCRGINLVFTTDVGYCVRESDIIFLAVNTPTKVTGIGAKMACDLSSIESAAREIAKHSTGHKIVVEKSTVPCQTAEKITAILESNSNVHFEVLSNPEFLAEGTAIQNLISPDRVLIGGTNTEEGRMAQEVLANLYRRWIPEEKIIKMNVWSVELAKLAANAMLAQRISSINSLSQICEEIGADVEEVAHALGTDNRIGKKFLGAGIGFGGSCFTKDILSLVYIAKSLHLEHVAEYWKQVIVINEEQKIRFIKRIVSNLFDTLHGKKIAIFGVAFKNNTADVRESPGLALVRQFAAENAILNVYDPMARAEDIHHHLRDLKKSTYIVHSDAYSAVVDNDAIVICTEWNEFAKLDYDIIYKSMRKPASIFDGRIVVNADQLRDIGFKVHTIGK